MNPHEILMLGNPQTGAARRALPPDGYPFMIPGFITGLILSFIGSMTPTGPIALIVLKYGMRRQRQNALFVAAGAALAEAGYALLAYLGITFALSRYHIEPWLLKLISGIILAIFSVAWILKGHSSSHMTRDRVYAGRSFLLGLSIAGLNPTFLVTWAGAVAIARGAGLLNGFQVAPAFAIGVMAGPVLWFWILLIILTHPVKYISPEKLEKIERALPYMLLVLAGYMLVQTMIQMIR
jgi:threonine/homoserine/homoserine lactone efflux protein